jgi:hypothetical protein
MIRTILGLLLLAACAIPASADGVSGDDLTLLVTVTNTTATLSFSSGTITLIVQGESGGTTFMDTLSSTSFSVGPAAFKTITIKDGLPVGTNTISGTITGFDQDGNAIYGYASGTTPVPPAPSTPYLFTVYTVGGPLFQTSAVSIGDADPFDVGGATTVGTLTPASTTPEPGTIGLTMIGVGLLMMLTRKRVLPAIR